MSQAKPRHRVPERQRSSSDDRLAALMRDVAHCDERAFAELYDATVAAVFGIVLRVLRSRSQAEEVVQEIYLEIWRTAARCDPARGTVRSWTNVIAHRRAIDRVRSSERSLGRDQRYHRNLDRAEVPGPEDITVARHDARDVQLAVAALPDIHRSALMLAYFDGRSHREIAAILDIPLGTVKTRIRTALSRLRTTPDLQSIRPA